MQITLNWTNRNVGEDGTRVFRSEAPINPLALPAPLATVAPGVTTYTDTTAVQDVVYYYRTEIFKGADKILNNRDIVISGKPYTGPGPQSFQSGNSEIGFYGDVLGTELLTYPELVIACGVTTGNAASTIDRWLKFAYKGKLLFVARHGIRLNLSWKMLYDLGLVYGVDGPGTDLPSGVAPVSQNKIITVRGSEYRVRLLKGLPGPSGTVTPMGVMGGSDVTENLTGSEWNDLFYRLSSRSDLRFAPSNRFRSIDNGLVAANSSPQTSTLCQERAGDVAATTVIVRGARNNASVSDGFYMGHASEQIATAVNTSKPTNTLNMTFAASFTPLWRPVLELIV